MKFNITTSRLANVGYNYKTITITSQHNPSGQCRL